MVKKTSERKEGGKGSPVKVAADKRTRKLSIRTPGKILNLGTSLRLLKRKVISRPRIEALNSIAEKKILPVLGAPVKEKKPFIRPPQSKKVVRKLFQSQGTLFISKEAVLKTLKGMLNEWSDEVPLESLRFKAKGAESPKLERKTPQVSEEANEKLVLGLSNVMDRVLSGAARTMWAEGRVTLEAEDLDRSLKSMSLANPELKIFEYWRESKH